jgi:caa(3)-type oxidase subunit IV
MNDSPLETGNNYTRRCLYIFGAVVCGTLLMVAASFVPLGSRSLNIALVLAAACFNAFLVAGFLMHLISERKMIYTVLAFTVFFCAGLMVLTIYAAHDVPRVIPN